MNSVLRSVAKVCAAQGVQLVGVLDGYEGLIAGRFEPLTAREAPFMPRADLELAGGIGGTVLGSARSKRFLTGEGRAKALRSLAGVDGLIVVGGNGSLTGAHLLATEHGVRVIGIPASIDNDIGCTATALGVDTALNTIVEACDKVSDTARAHKRAFVVEVMGRQCGYLAMASAVAAGADGVLFREQDRTEAQLVEALAQVIRRAYAVPNKRRVLIIKAEGVEVPCTRLVREVEERLEADQLGIGVRAVVLGHLVRGGCPSFQDRMVAGRFGMAAVMALLAGQTDQMVGWGGTAGGGGRTQDPMVRLFPLSRVLEETQAMIDGTSPVTRWRVEMLRQLEGVLPL
jgi:6-phosphofructokinase 1